MHYILLLLCESIRAQYDKTFVMLWLEKIRIPAHSAWLLRHLEHRLHHGHIIVADRLLVFCRALQDSLRRATQIYRHRIHT